MAGRPCPSHEKAEHEEWEYPKPGQSQQVGVRMAGLGVEDPAPLDPDIATILRMVSREIGPERYRNAGKRRMQRLVRESVFFKQLHTRSDMCRFVESQRKHIVGGHDPRGGDKNGDERKAPQAPPKQRPRTVRLF